ncbi:Starch-binding associating with outer membrane, partial [Popillia japonica]
AFRLKVLMSMSKKEGDAELDVKGEFSKIVTGNEPLLRSNQDNGQLIYLDQAENRYPLFNSSSFGSGMYIDSTFIKRLQDHSDPRLFLIDSTFIKRLQDHSDPRLFLFCTQTKEAKEAGKAIDDFTAYEGGNPVVPYNQVNEKATKGKVSKRFQT